ncbi:type II secretion system ATPase GspE [Yersinia aleksiciae]|uniref:Type II secretion system protein E n=1 Tax=Yersinia aleksiciae TaxID=263819 RepID=A0ABM5UAU2_YERAE|nr:type II secretion system ATPase GspE [Yersinia aleksiciae]AKP32938.1 general secretion pathway protein GspE [Yersinia aleksiciae]CFQ52932.1 general secretion pathway protein E [Yersinia aleksiciae]
MTQKKTESPLLNFIWSRDNGVILLPLDQGYKIICRHSSSLEAILEGNRVANQAVKLDFVTDDDFDANLVDIYQNSSMQSHKIINAISEEIDSYSFSGDLPDSEDLLDTSNEAPVIRLINTILAEAIKELASDIHIESFEKKLIIRFRIDGVLRNILELQKGVALLLVSRIKVMAKLDIAEKRAPQDGRIALNLAGRALDVRVSVLPSNHGERVVMRLLDKSSIKLDLQSLGMSQINCDAMSKLVLKPHGIVLIVGPTGAGKSTTLYAALMGINSHERNIMTVEDPIEFDIDRISQTQVNSKIGMTFSRSLRAILRQDPDVILIGEIRDVETAQIAVQASLTGHLVLSTLHANSAVGAVTRLKDMGIEPFMLASSLLAVLSQRLIRKLCFECRQEYLFTQEMLKELGINYPLTMRQSAYRAMGCSKCNATGYRGRIALHELLLVDKNLREGIYKSSSEFDLASMAQRTMRSIEQDGVDKIIAGLTTIEEVIKIGLEDKHDSL